MKIALLPLYIKLYDEVVPERQASMQAFADTIAGQFTRRGFDIVQAPICRIKPEFDAAIRTFEREGAEAIVTLHLAYSPSLESIDALAGTKLPIIVLDTTPDESFGFDFGDKVMANHGIHGVQDCCNMLIRRGKRFLIAAGHWEKSDVIDRACNLLKAAAMACKMRTARVGTVGGEFAGMGDFCVPAGTFGMEIVAYTEQPEADAAAVAAERRLDLERFVPDALFEAVHERTLRASLKLRRWVEQARLDAFTLCFLGITREAGWETVPFLEASKAMARGIGYAGEGDVLTAALVAALMRTFPETSFTEMFCPDWSGNRLFLSHMGEINIALTAQKPLLAERAYIFSDTDNPVLATGCFRAGQAMLVNLAPGPAGTFTLISAAVTLDAPETPSTRSNTGWFTPAALSVERFLEAYSRAGGTHHLALAYKADAPTLAHFAELMDWKHLHLG
jgi:L-arabinose isomerase